jgi:hypothetical protein
MVLGPSIDGVVAANGRKTDPAQRTQPLQPLRPDAHSTRR